ncbi:MAG: nucleotide exchange factor GrpE [Rhodobacteraceae bacterium]|nr:nucleotide exchange factor GrpE [Paracoccaceae bacterium]
MADPKKKDELDLEDILAGVSEDELVDLDTLAAQDPEADGEGLLAEIEALKAERDDMRDRFMRALADAENARKRGERDRREGEQYGGSRLARDMLPVYDNLNRALRAAAEHQSDADKALIEGVELTLRELLNIFTKHSISLIAPQRGDKFDPQLHQAMFEAPVPGTVAGDIIEVMTQGFLLHDRLLRPAQVGVSSTPSS